MRLRPEASLGLQTGKSLSAQRRTTSRSGKLAKPMHEPFGSKVGRCADCQYASGLALNEAISAKSKPIERVADHGKIRAAGFGNDKPLAFSIEELDPKCRLQRLDLLAHSGLCDTQLLRGPREAFATSRSLERFDGV